MKTKQPLACVGSVLLIAGAILFLAQGRVMTTFILDAIVSTISDEQTIPPVEFSWGMFEPHTSLPQLLLTTIGLGVAMLGCLSAMPIVSLPAAGKGKLQKTFLILLGLALLVSAFGTWFIAQRTISEFAYMKESGAPDPHSFGQAMAVGVWRVGRVALLLASLLIAGLVMMRKPDKSEDNPSPSGGTSIVRMVGMIFLALSLAMLLVVAIGPATILCRMAQPGAAELFDPAELASLISTAVGITYAAGVVMGLSALLTLASAFGRNR